MNLGQGCHELFAFDLGESVTVDEAVRARFPNGAPPALAAAIAESFEQMRSDTAGLRTTTIVELLGRPPRDFATWCRAHREIFGPTD